MGYLIMAILDLRLVDCTDVHSLRAKCIEMVPQIHVEDFNAALNDLMVEGSVYLDLPSGQYYLEV